MDDTIDAKPGATEASAPLASMAAAGCGGRRNGCSPSPASPGPWMPPTSASSSPAISCPPTCSAPRSTSRRTGPSPSAGARYSPPSCSPTRSTAHHPRCRARCSRRCRRARSRSAARSTRCRSGPAPWLALALSVPLLALAALRLPHRRPELTASAAAPGPEAVAPADLRADLAAARTLIRNTAAAVAEGAGGPEAGSRAPERGAPVLRTSL